jgi:hypothetical protein
VLYSDIVLLAAIVLKPETICRYYPKSKIADAFSRLFTSPRASSTLLPIIYLQCRPLLRMADTSPEKQNIVLYFISNITLLWPFDPRPEKFLVRDPVRLILSPFLTN